MSFQDTHHDPHEQEICDAFDEGYQSGYASGEEAGRTEALYDFDHTIATALEDVLVEISDEVTAAQSRYEPFASAHEGLAIIEEEFEELKGEVFKSPSNRSYTEMYEEAKQLAAMAVRFMLDVDDKLCAKEDQ